MKHAQILNVLAVLMVGFFTGCGWLGNFKVNNPNKTTTQNSPGETGSVSSVGVSAPNGLQISAPQPAVADRCWPITVASTYNGVASPVSSATTVNLTLPSGVTAYSTSTCATGSETTTATIPKGSSSTIVWVKAPIPGNYLIGCSGPGLPETNINLVVNNNNDGTVPVRMAVSGPNSTAADTCTAYTMSLFGSDNNYAAFKTASTLTLSSSDLAMKFYSNSSCSGNDSPFLALPANYSNLTFYLKAPSTGLKSVVASANSLQGQLLVLVLPQMMTKTVIQGATVLSSNQCGVFTVNLQDNLGNLVTTSSAVNVQLSRVGEGAFYADSNCTAQVTSVSIPPNNSGSYFFYKGTTPSTNVVTSKVTGLADGTFTFNVNSGSTSTASKLGFETGLSATSAGNCLGPIKVQIQDANGNTLTNVSSILVNLNQTGSGKFYADSSCLNTVISSATNTEFYFKDTVAENIVWFGNDASGTLPAATKNFSVTAGAKYQLAVLGTFSPIAAGSCQPLDVFYADPFMNAVVSSVDAAVSLQEDYPTSGKFYSDAACGNLLASASNVFSTTIPALSLKKVVYFRETKAGAGKIRAFDNVVKEGRYDFQVNAGSAVKLALENSPTSGGANSCVGPLKFVLLDTFDNKTVTNNLLSLNLSSNLGSFYSDSACGSIVNPAQIPAGSGGVSIYFMTPTPGTIAAIATPSANPPAPLNFSLVIDGTTTATRVAIIGKSPLTLRGPVSVLVGNCVPFALRTENSAGNAAPLSANSNFQISSSASGVSFFSNSSCSNSLTLPMTTNGSETLFYAKSSNASVGTISAIGAGLPSLGYDVQFSPAALASVQVSGPASTVAGVCEGPFLIQGKDSAGNITPLASGTSFSLSGASQGFFHKVAGCSDSGSAATSVSVTSPAVNASFYYRNTKAESVTLGATSSVGNATKALTINVGSAAYITLVGPVSTPVNVCSGALQFAVVDAFGNAIITNYDRLYSLSQNGSITFYTENCATPISSVSILANQPLSQKFSFKATSTQSTILTISGPSGNGPTITQNYGTNPGNSNTNTNSTNWNRFGASGIFTPPAGVSSVRVMVVGGGGKGTRAFAGGSGWVRTGICNVSGAVVVTVGGPNEQSSFGSCLVASAGGNATPARSGHGGSGGGGSLSNGDGGRGGMAGSNGLGGSNAGQGGHFDSLSLFSRNSITAGSGGQGGTHVGATTMGGMGGAGGVLFNDQGPQGENGIAGICGGDANHPSLYCNPGMGGVGYGAGGGGTVVAGSQYVEGVGPSGARGVVYVEW